MTVSRPLENLGAELVEFDEKEHRLQDYVRQFLVKTQSMFLYDGLPDDLDQKFIELYLQTKGHCGFIKFNDKIYVCQGSWGGDLDPYFIPEEYLITNPYLKMEKSSFIRNKDVIVGKNDSLYNGLLPLINKYGSLLVENELSLKLAIVNTRIQQFIGADDDRTKASAEEFLRNVDKGKDGVIATNQFFDSLKVIPVSGINSNSAIQSLIELEQYLKASFYNELGLNSNYNMKRESINSNESQLNDDMLHPLVDDMLKCREQMCKEVNEMFGLNISVHFNSAWEINEKEEQAEIEMLENQSDQMEPEQKEGDEDVQNEQKNDEGSQE